MAEKFGLNSHATINKYREEMSQKINLLFVTDNPQVPEELVELAEFKPFLYGIWNVNRNNNNTLKVSIMWN